MDDQPLLVGLGIGEQLGRGHPLQLAEQLADPAPIKRPRQRGEELPRGGQRQQFGERHRRHRQLVHAAARLN